MSQKRLDCFSTLHITLYFPVHTCFTRTGFPGGHGLCLVCSSLSRRIHHSDLASVTSGCKPLPL